MQNRHTLRITALIGAICFFGAGCEQAAPTGKFSISDPQESTGSEVALETKKDGLIVSGVVTDSSSGKPIPGARVFLKQLTKYVYADVNGHYRLDIPIYRSVDVTLTAGMEYYEVTKAHTEPFSPGRELLVHFSLIPVVPQPGFTLITPEARYVPGEDAISVRVINGKSGDAVPDVTVLVLHSSMGGKTDADGRMRFKGIDPRYPTTYRVSLLDYNLAMRFPESKNEYMIHFVPGYMTDITLPISPK